MQLTRPDPRQKQGTPPTTPLTQVHPQPAPLHFMQQQPQQSQLAGRFPMPPIGVLPHEPSQLSFFGSRDSQPPPLMSPVAMVCSCWVYREYTVSPISISLLILSMFLGRLRRPYIVFRFRFLYGFMFVYILYISVTKWRRSGFLAFT